jgi:hypothetical protein
VADANSIHTFDALPVAGQIYGTDEKAASDANKLVSYIYPQLST